MRLQEVQLTTKIHVAKEQKQKKTTNDKRNKFCTLSCFERKRERERDHRKIVFRYKSGKAFCVFYVEILSENRRRTKMGANRKNPTLIFIGRNWLCCRCVCPGVSVCMRGRERARERTSERASIFMAQSKAICYLRSHMCTQDVCVCQQNIDLVEFCVLHNNAVRAHG